MNHDEIYEAWKERRAQGEVPTGFADRVMAAIEADTAAGRGRSVLQQMLLIVLSSRLGKVSLCTVAAAMCFFRLMHVIAIFVPQ